MTRRLREAADQVLSMARAVPTRGPEAIEPAPPCSPRPRLRETDPECPPPVPVRPLSEIDAELQQLTINDREEHSRRRRIEQLNHERDQAITAAAEAERLKKIAAMMPEWERARAAYASKISQVEEAMQALMVEFYEALKHGIEANRWKGRIEREGGKVCRMKGFQLNFIDYFNYPKLTELHRAAGLGNMASGAARARESMGSLPPAG